MKKYLILLLSFSLSALAAVQKEGVNFSEPKNGARVGQKVKLKFNVIGMKVQPAGALVEKTGHHHVIVDGGSTVKGSVVPADETHLHYGKGQTEAEVQLAPGEHKLTLQFADGAHRSYGEKWSKTITVHVK